MRLMACNEWHNIHDAQYGHSNKPFYNNSWFIVIRTETDLHVLKMQPPSIDRRQKQIYDF